MEIEPAQPAREDAIARMLDRRDDETHRLIRVVICAQWVVVLALAPTLWVLAASTLLAGLALLSIRWRPRAASTRHVVAVAQVGWSALLVVVTHDDPQTYLHLLVSAVLVAFYRDWRVLLTAGVAIAVGLAVRIALGHGVADTVELAGWTAFVMALLVVAAVRATRELKLAARRQARLHRTNTIVERHVQQRTLELQEVADRYRAIVENTEAVTFEYDVTARRMMYLSPQAARLLECSEAALEQRDAFARFVHASDHERVLADLGALVHGTRSWEEPIDCRLVAATGRVIHVRTFLNARAGSRRIRAITVDVTRQRMVEAELHQAQKLESVGRLAAGVAHEINTPIQFVGDSVAFMQDAIGDVLAVFEAQQAVTRAVLAGEPAEALAAAAEARIADADLPYVLEQLPAAGARALDGVERVGSIVRSMKVFAHPDASEMTAVDLNHVVQSTVTVARNEYRYVATLDTDLGELPPITCYAGEISQVVLNLVINAAHAIGDIHAQTGTRGQIKVGTVRDGEQVRITVRDTGGGIPETVRDRIFEPFFTTKPVGKGTGQGLAMARAVIERHRGTITFDTVINVGTTFEIRIPIDASRPAVAQRDAA